MVLQQHAQGHCKVIGEVGLIFGCTCWGYTGLCFRKKSGWNKEGKPLWWGTTQDWNGPSTGSWPPQFSAWVRGFTCSGIDPPHLTTWMPAQSCSFSYFPMQISVFLGNKDTNAGTITLKHATTFKDTCAQTTLVKFLEYVYAYVHTTWCLNPLVERVTLAFVNHVPNFSTPCYISFC